MKNIIASIAVCAAILSPAAASAQDYYDEFTASNIYNQQRAQESLNRMQDQMNYSQEQLRRQMRQNECCK